MTMPATTARSRAPLVVPLLLALAALAACAERGATPSPPPGVASAVAGQSNLMLDTTFDYFGAHLALRMTGQRGLSRPDAYRAVYYTVRRTLGANNVWTTAMTIDSASPFGRPVSGGQSTFEVGRIEFTSDGRTFRIYDRQGVLLPAPLSVRADTIKSSIPGVHPASIVFPTWPTITRPSGTLDRAALALRVGSDNASAAASAAGDPRGFLTHFALSPAARERLRAALAARFGAPTGRIGALDRYVHRGSGTTQEILYDPGLGAIVEENLTEGSELRAHLTHRYQNAAFGNLVRVGSRIELAPSAPGRDRTILEITLSDVRLEKRGGAR